MTTRKHLKARVRSRMEKTGERYAAARAHVVTEASPAATPTVPATPTVAGIRHFPRGRQLWTGLTSLHRFVEAYFTGGGLMRPMVARALSRDPTLAATGERYAALGAEWTALARAALPDDAPLLAEARTIQERVPGLFVDRGPAAADELRAAWARLAELSDEAAAEFPLSEAEVSELVADLAARLRSIHAAEVAALADLREAASAG